MATFEEIASKLGSPEEAFADVRVPYDIESTQEFQNLPQQAQVSTIDPDTGEAIYGTKQFSQFVPARSHVPLSQAPKQVYNRKPLVEAAGSLGYGTQTALGLPVDVLAGGYNALANLVNLPAIDKPVLGSKWLHEATGGWKPEGYTGNIAAAIGENVPYMAMPLARAAKSSQPLLQAVKPYIASAVSGGTGVGVARERNMGPLSELAAAVLFGAAPNVRQLVGPTVEAAAEKVTQRFPGAAAILTEPSNIDLSIKQAYTRAIKPSVQGKQQFSDWQNSANKAVSAIKSIVQYSKAHNTPVPRNLEEFSEAVQSTRQNVFNKYSALTQQADSGLNVTFDPIVTDLKQLKTAPLQDWGPDTIKAIDDVVDVLQNRKAYTVSDAEKAIALLNSKLKGYYAGRSGGMNDTTASVYDTVARYMRAALNSAIENATGANYQGLKNEYGALKSIEKDVINKTIQDSRKTMNVLDFSDMFSASKAVYSAAKLDPAGAAAAATVYGVKQALKKAKDPNRIVEKMFKQAEKVVPAAEQWGPLEKANLPPKVYPSNRPERMLQPGEKANAVVIPKTTVQTVAPFDFDAALSDLVNKQGMNAIEARDMLTRFIKDEIKRRH